MRGLPHPGAAARPRRAGAGVGLLTALAVVAGCTGADPGAGSAQSPSPSAAGDYDLSGLPVAREPFCDDLDPDSITRALGSGVFRAQHYVSGDRAEITPGYVDLAAEHDCTFIGLPPASARVWVFARPVRAREARVLAREARSAPGCTFPDGPRFGTPHATSVCPTEDPAPALRVRMAGLFGSTWLTCELTRPRPGGPQRAGRAQVLAVAEQWCVEVATTLGARP